MQKAGEKALLLRLQNGDREAFNNIYDNYSTWLYIRMLKLLKDHHIVEELVQDIFLKIWERRGEIMPEKGFTAFLMRISDNLAINTFRKIARDRKLREELWYNLTHSYEHIEQKYFQEENSTILQKALDRLPPKRREVFVLCKLQEKSYQEVAEKLGVSISTVSNQLVVAVRDVKKFIADTYTEHDFKVMIISFLFIFLK